MNIRTDRGAPITLTNTGDNLKTFKTIKADNIRERKRRTDAEVEAIKQKYNLKDDYGMDEWYAAIKAEGEEEYLNAKKTRQEARKGPKKPPLEHEIQREIGKALEEAGYMVIRINSSTNFTEHGTRLSSYRIVNINATSGHADLVVYKRGRAWMLEVKRPGGKPSETQVRFAECCNRYGVPYHVVTSPEDALAVLRLP